MKVRKTKIKKLPKGVTYNPELNKYSNVNLFPDKVARAIETLKKFPPPKDVFTL
jgi:hypothetical protein